MVVVGCCLKVLFGNCELVGVVVGYGQIDDGQGLCQVLVWCDLQLLLQGEFWQSLQWLVCYIYVLLGEVLSIVLFGLLCYGEVLFDICYWGWQLIIEGYVQCEKLCVGSCSW